MTMHANLDSLSSKSKASSYIMDCKAVQEAMAHVVVTILLCFLCASCHLTYARPMDVDGCPLGNKMCSPNPAGPIILAASRNKIQSRENHNDVNHVAGWSTLRTQPYYGTRAKISVWSSSQEHSQESGAYINVYDGSSVESFNSIVAGLHVFPDLYHNHDVRFFISWTRDGHGDTGCYNLGCPGFVPASGAALKPGQAVAPSSTYDGEDRYITISLHMDPKKGDWLLYRDDFGTSSFLGHFPKELFPKLNAGTPDVGWFGFVDYLKNEPGPSMGSGHFPTEGARKAAYFKNIQLFDSKDNAYDPRQNQLTPIVTRKDCYRVSELFQAKDDGLMFYYGGPRGCPSGA